jgi:hypothetical protein
MGDQAVDVVRGSTEKIPSKEYEFIDSKALAQRWCLPETWVRDQVRRRSSDTLPHIKFGKYVRFLWGCPELASWLERRMIGGNNKAGRTPKKESVQ